GSGNVYVEGFSNATWGSPVRAYSGGSDVFAAKLSAAGALTWNTFLGGNGTDTDSGQAIVDGSGNVYVAGNSDATWGSPGRTFTGTADPFAAKLNSAGALTWNTFLNDTSSDYGYALAVDGSGNVYVAGSADGTWGSPVSAFSGGVDAFVAKLSAAGALTWSTF